MTGIEHHDIEAVDSELQQWRRALAAAAEQARPGEDCPPAEDVWRAVAGELEPAAVAELVDHVAVCPVCAEAWDLARELQTEPAAAAPAHDVAAAWGVESPANDDDEGFWRPWLQVAALVVVLLGAGLLVPRGFLPDETPPSMYRGGGEPLSALTPRDVPQPKDALVLRWQPYQPATEPAGGAPVEYEVRLLHETAQGTHLLLRLIGERTTLEVPAGVVGHVPVGTRLLWEVIAFEDGEEVARRTHPVILGEPSGSPDVPDVSDIQDAAPAGGEDAPPGGPGSG